MTTVDCGVARRMWHPLEPAHAVLFRAPEVFAEAAALGYGVRTRWSSHFARRPAPLGAPGPRQVCSVFCSFSPHMVAEHVPAIWTPAPQPVLSARLPGDEPEGRTARLADAPWRALGAGRAQRLAELTRPICGAVLASALLPARTILCITTASTPTPRP